MAPPVLTRDDLQQLDARGISRDEALRQLELLRHPPEPPRLERASTLSDGIEAISEPRRAALAALADQAASAGRVRAFVPASGAASRMFQDIITCRTQGVAIPRAWLAEKVAAGMKEAQALHRFIENVSQFAFYDALESAVRSRGIGVKEVLAKGPIGTVLDALLERPGLGYAHLPKGLIPFHRAADRPRTAFEEHLFESAKLMREERGLCRMHFTVSPEHRQEFGIMLIAARVRFETALGVEYEVTFSEQSPATDTLALDGAGQLFRGSDGRLLLRPAGHGALIENLNALGADLAFIKNIDNVAHQDWKEPTWLWTRVLIGRLVELQSEAFALFDRLEGGDGQPVEAAVAFCEQAFSAAPPEGSTVDQRRAWVRDRLDRPIRVCGMVRNTGEPGGGPFWVRGKDGVRSLQIVEHAQVDPASPQQQKLFTRGTHFNPVYLACALRRRDGKPHDLKRYVDESAVILASKAAGGRKLLALERPGLWNGAMAGWNTALVEVPTGVFNPVKTVLDLLRPEHQPK